MAINDNFEVKITSVFQGDIMMNVLHYMQTGGEDGITSIIGKLLDAVESDIVPVMADCQATTIVYQSIRVQQVGVNKPIIEKRAIDDVGEHEDNPLPAQDAVLFVKRANTGGRENVGKFYLGGVGETLSDGGKVVVGDANLIAMAVALKSNLTSGGITFAPIIWHRATQTAEFITKCDIRSQISRQNRRHLPVY